jgi:hypothetical protein
MGGGKMRETPPDVGRMSILRGVEQKKDIAKADLFKRALPARPAKPHDERFNFLIDLERSK